MRSLVGRVSLYGAPQRVDSLDSQDPAQERG